MQSPPVSAESEGTRMRKKLIRDEEGQDVIEYAILISFISIAAIATLQAIAPLLGDFYHDVVINRFVNYVCR